METNNIIVTATDEQFNALKAFLKALKIKFEMSKDDEYNPEFVAEIQESREQIKEGKTTRVAKKDLSNFLGLD